jgi:hypothetical protein
MTFPDFIATGLDEKHRTRLDKAIVAIAGYEDEKLITKSELEAVKYDVNQAFEKSWRTLVSEVFTYNGKLEKLSLAEYALETKVAWPAAHTVAGYLKRVAGAKPDTHGALRDVMLRWLEEAAPIGTRVMALKALIGRRAPKATKTSIARDERAALAMTCQCCARDILAERGEIAHHGYQRPGSGYQTASCEGALTDPFEVSRAALGTMLSRMRDYVVHRKTHLIKIEREMGDLNWTYTDRTLRSRTSDGEVTVQVNRATFPAIFEEAKPRFHYNHTTTFDEIKGAAIREVKVDIKMTQQSIDIHTARYDGWKQTHERKGDQWVALEA